MFDLSQLDCAVCGDDKVPAQALMPVDHNGELKAVCTWCSGIETHRVTVARVDGKWVAWCRTYGCDWITKGKRLATVAPLADDHEHLPVWASDPYQERLDAMARELQALVNEPCPDDPVEWTGDHVERRWFEFRTLNSKRILWARFGVGTWGFQAIEAPGPYPTAAILQRAYQEFQ